MTDIDPNAPDAPDAEPTGTVSGSPLRGSFVAVLVMTAFFLASWFAILAIALERR
jgi:hypothetical protein